MDGLIESTQTVFISKVPRGNKVESGNLLDRYSRKVIGWAISKRIAMSLRVRRLADQ